MKKLFILIGSLILILIIVKIFKDNNSNDTSPGRDSIISTAEEFVKQELKAPSTAEFSPSSETSIKETDPNVYEVRGYVDAQNSFGAMIRNSYYVRLHFSPYNKTYSVTDVKLE